MPSYFAPVPLQFVANRGRAGARPGTIGVATNPTWLRRRPRVAFPSRLPATSGWLQPVTVRVPRSRTTVGLFDANHTEDVS